MSTYPLVQQIEIGQQIYQIRGLHVMLDSDLANLFEVPVKRLNEQVQRNISRFPGSFMFQLSKEEFERLRSQIATSKDEAKDLKSNTFKYPAKSSFTNALS